MNLQKEETLYGVFTNKKTDKKLVFYPCPKNANSSAKLFFIKHLGLEEKFYFLSDEIPEYRFTKMNIKNKNNLIGFLPAKQKFSPMPENFIKCCIVRDPLERFLSAYKNRVLFHKDKDFHGLNIDEILLKLENKEFDNKHFLPQNFFLGMDLKYYDFYANVKKIFYFENKVNNFFDKKFQFPKIQTGGKNYKVALTNIQTERIMKIYKNDYIFLKTGR